MRASLGVGLRRAALPLLLTASCTTTPFAPQPGGAPALGEPVPDALSYEPIALDAFRVTPEGLNVERSLLVRLYTFLHSRDYSVSRVEFPGHAGGTAVAHWLVPNTAGPHATVVVFPILAGTHVVSELVAKKLVNRGYAVAHIERKELELETATDPGVPSSAMRNAVRDARRLLDWLEAQPQVDRRRIATAGVSMGGMLACILQGSDPRVRAGFYALAGGGLAELLYDSAEKPVRMFRDRVAGAEKLSTRDDFVTAMRSLTQPIDPLTVASRIPPDSVLIASGRLDRVMPPARTELLWKALGRPTWIHLPFGHYQSLPFLWWTVGRGADHFDAYFARAPEPERVFLNAPPARKAGGGVAAMGAARLRLSERASGAENRRRRSGDGGGSSPSF